MKRNVVMMMLLVSIGYTNSYSQSNYYNTKDRIPNMRGYKPTEEDKIETTTKEKIDTVIVSKLMVDSVLEKMAKDEKKKKVFLFNDDPLVDYRKGFEDGEEMDDEGRGFLVGTLIGREQVAASKRYPPKS